jgi:hypothetical protein
MKHVVRDFLQERENRATIIYDTIQYCTEVCEIETIVNIIDTIYRKKTKQI